QNIFLEEFGRLLALPSSEIFPAQEPDAVLLKLRQKSSETGLLLPDHADDHSAQIGQKFGVSSRVLDHQNRDPLHEELIEIGREDGEKLKALKQWRALVQSLRQHTAIKFKPSEVPVQPQFC